ncbi:MAG TPA: DUF4097 family beta strand repeat-containing protein [Bacilli bacterium]|nr:DUF4097 family beta strand repeat-containing protein [Bacilli bacterium]
MLNKIIKISVIVIFIGVVFATIGAIVVGANFEDIVARYNKDEDYSFVEQTSSNLVTTIKVEGINRKIVFLPTEEADIKLEYYESERDYFTYTEESGVIHLKNKVKLPQMWIFPSWISPHINNINVYIPESFSGVIEVSSTNGALNLSDLPEITRLVASTTNGEILVRRMNMTGNLKATTTNGKIQIESAVVGGSIEASTTNGKVISIDNQSSNISLVTTNGNVEVTHQGLKESFKIDVRTTNGTISLDGLKIASQILHGSQTSSIKARTTNGNITISFHN